jgi:3-oxoadipate enol-lactonase
VRRSGLAGLGPQVVAANFSRRTCQERPEVTALYAKLFELQSPEAYAEAAEALVAWHAPALPRMNDIPCLTITGDEDLYAPPDRVRAFAETLPHGTRVEVMRDCGHVPFLEQPDVFARLVEPFLSRLRWDSTQAARADRR